MVLGFSSASAERDLLRVELDDELLADRQRHVVACRHRLDHAFEGVLVELDPSRHAAPLDRAERLDDAAHGARLLAHLDRVVGAHQVRRDVDPAAVDLEVAVPHQLARLGVVAGEAHPVDHVVEPALEQLDEVVAGHALPARRLVVVAAELALGDPVDALDLLLLAQLLAVVRPLAPARLAVLTRRIRPPLVAALVGVAALALEEELHVFAAAQPADGSDVTSHDELTPSAAWAG